MWLRTSRRPADPCTRRAARGWLEQRTLGPRSVYGQEGPEALTTNASFGMQCSEVGRCRVVNASRKSGSRRARNEPRACRLAGTLPCYRGCPMIPVPPVSAVAPTTKAVPAAVLAFVFPGLGHIFAGHGARGLFWLLAPGAPVVAGLALVFSWWPALVIGFALALVLTLASIFDAYRAGKSPRQVGLIWPSIYGASTLSLIACCVAAPFVIRTFVVESFRIPSGGMCPTLSVGDSLFVDKAAYGSSTPSHGDIVVYAGPDEPGVMFLQRVVGVGGDIVEVREGGGLTVSGRPIPTTPLTETGCDGLVLLEEDLGGKHRIAKDPGVRNDHQRHEVPPDHVFLLGDNRDNSFDSRLRGAVPVSAVKGRAFKRWMHDGRVVWEDLH